MVFPVASTGKGTGSVASGAMPVLAGDGTVAPIDYATLTGIDSYVGTDKKPTSLKTSNTTDPNQFYGVFLTSDATSTATKIAIAVLTTTDDDLAKAQTDIVGYDGKAPGVAYVEP